MPIEGSDVNASNREEEAHVLARTWHARAREAAGEKRRTLLSLSSGGVATFFFALTANEKGGLTLLQKVTLSCGASLFGTAVICGVLIWHAEVKRAYNAAKAQESTVKPTKSLIYGEYRRWTKIKKSLVFVQLTSFSLGIVAAVVFTISKVWSH
ncbi:hypothetical protein [Burkholderia ubonensis]|uniref:hypothetical protein n=1 Tax=Burkholderia ubonensis TaxID=101571 RepID=UPI0012FCF3FC|nr:hypothetical protein [Burkholderia ubonensis]